ncbi:MAG: nuclear transport factor 2 family protein [Actinomycetota bacterium]|nr:nuclear transport factor 2 family protein [Actinomycetota bacterium]
MDDDRNRAAREVFEDHLRQGKHGSVEEDFARNYSEDVVLLTGRGVYRGRKGLQRLAQMLAEELPGADFEYRTKLVEGEMAFLEWKAHSKDARVDDGADSFCIRDGRIVSQTIHYTVEPLSEQRKAGGQQ